MSPCESCGHPDSDHSDLGCHWNKDEEGQLSPVGEGVSYCPCRKPGDGE